ncbi:MAG TPA: condensation domain-containing protein, partial [Steroidobacteraceae bacterium]
MEGEVVQRIGPPQSGFDLGWTDLSGLADGPAQLSHHIAQEVGAPFDLEHGPLIRGHVVRMGAQEHVLLLTMHHIISDGWSIGVLGREVSALYAAYSRGAADPLAPLPVQYADYAAWQRRWLSGEMLAEQTDYWRRALAGAPALLELPTDRRRPAQQDFTGGHVALELDETLSDGLKALSHRHGMTLFMTLLAGWALVLSRLSGQQDVVIGVPSANRSRLEVEGLIGFFVNTLALRIELGGTPTLAQLLERVKEVALQAQDNQELPFEQVVDLVKPVRSLSHTPVFQVMFAWQSEEGATLDLPGLQAAGIKGPRSAAKFDLTLDLKESGGRIVGGLNYAAALFDQQTVERYGAYLRNALAQMVGDAQQTAAALPLLPQTERQRLVEDWNATQAPYPSQSCIHQLFEAQVARAAQAPAVVHEERTLSYGELNAQANRLARHLRRHGVTADSRVGICVERSAEMVVGLLAILKAGGAYVPLDPAYPADRLAYMLRDSDPALVLTHAPARPALHHALAAARRPIALLDLNDDAAQWAADSPHNLAYVIYTSGSTGHPKGVMNEHRGVVNRLLWMQDTYRIDHADAVLQKTPFSFDVSVWEFFWPLLTGAQLVIAKPGGHRDPHYLVDLITEQQITVAHFVPPMLRMLLAEPEVTRCRSLRHVICSGEALPYDLQQQFFRLLPGQLHNLYGPT